MRSSISLVVCVLLVLLAVSVSLAADVTPRLDASACSPAAGTTSTTFRYSIVYYGAEPSSHDVHIDTLGTSAIFSLHKVSTNAGGGALYVYETKLAAGAHKYRFRFATGTTVLRKPGPTGSEWYTGPTVAAGGETYKISGLVKANDVAFASIEVRLSRNGSLVKSTTTNAEGRYTFSSLAAGTYVVTPVKSGYRMDPLSRTITVGPSATTCNFRAIKL